jgi:DNA-binding MarR family transcriptional regulator
MSNTSTKRILKVKFKLLELMTFKENLTQRLLANSVGLSLGHTNKVLDELALNDYINIIKDTEHGKRFLYQLTPEGERYMVQIANQLAVILIDEYNEAKSNYSSVITILSKYDKDFKLDTVRRDIISNWLYDKIDKERR